LIAILAIAAVWAFAIAGYGYLFNIVKDSLREADDSLDLLQPFLGMAVLSALVNLINFFLPISNIVSVLLLLLGLGLFVRKQYPFQRPSWEMLAFSIIWLAAISAARALNRVNYYDSGLYGLQALDWLRAQTAPLGLANLQGRLGFDSAWFSFAAALQLPFLPVRMAVADEVLDLFVGIALFGGLVRLFQKGPERRHVFLALVALTMVTPILSAFAIEPLVYDVPIFWLTLAQGFVLLAVLDGKTRPVYAIWISSALAAFAVTIKLSGAPLFLAPATIAVIRWNELGQDRASLQRALRWAAGFGIAIGLPWATRNYLLSGCWLYPLAFTCEPRVAWAVPLDQVRVMSLLVLAQARMNVYDYAGVLANWDWLRQWLPLQWRSTELRFLLILFVVSLLGLLWSSLRGAASRPHREAWLIQLPFLAGTLIWFFSAPAVRFGAGYVWAMTLLMLTVCLWPLVSGATQAQNLGRFFLATVLCAIFIVFGVRFLVGAVSPEVSMADHWLFPASPPVPQVHQFVTARGQILYVPSSSDNLCWEANLLCTPYPDAALNFTEADGRYKMFYISQGQ
jgi:hypothetical protein